MSESAEEFEKRVCAVALATGIKVKEFSAPFASKFVKGESADTAALTDLAIGQRMIAFAEAQPTQVVLLRPFNRLAPAALSAAERLEKANAAAASPAKAQTTELSASQRAWIERYGANAALDLVNEITHTKKKP